MSSFEIYTLVMCIIVYTILVALFSVLIGCLVRSTIRMIRAGLDDAEIKKEYSTRQWSSSWLDKLICLLLGVALIIGFAFSVYLYFTEDNFSASMPSLKVVKSGSMAEKYSGNQYLFDNDLNDQIAMFDLIVTEPLPSEFDLHLYDIVLYEADGTQIVHRIVGIEEPNDAHPNQRYFRIQGDANQYSDNYPVSYDQMRAIYKGINIPFLGHFVMFMQAPAGWMCVFLIVCAMFVIQFVEKKIEKEKTARYRIICNCSPQQSAVQSKSVVNRSSSNISVDVTPFVLSHTRFSLTIQGADPKIHCEYEKTRGGAVITARRSVCNSQHSASLISRGQNAIRCVPKKNALGNGNRHEKGRRQK